MFYNVDFRDNMFILKLTITTFSYLDYFHSLFSFIHIPPLLY